MKLIKQQFYDLELVANHSDLKVKNDALESALKEQNAALRRGQDQLLRKDQELLKLVKSLDGHNKQKQNFYDEKQILKKEITVSLLFSILALFAYYLYILAHCFFFSVCESDRSFYLQVLLEDCKNVVKVIKGFITKDLIDSQSDADSDSDSDSGIEGDRIYYILIFLKKFTFFMT